MCKEKSWFPPGYNFVDVLLGLEVAQWVNMLYAVN